MLTWSLGWAPSPARLAITSLAFMFEEVPEPVWKTSTGNWSSCSPSATALPAAAIRSARSRVEQAQLAVGFGRGGLDPAEPADDRDRNPLAGNGEVVDCFGGLATPELLSQVMPPSSSVGLLSVLEPAPREAPRASGGRRSRCARRRVGRPCRPVGRDRSPSVRRMAPENSHLRTRLVGATLDVLALRVDGEGQSRDQEGDGEDDPDVEEVDEAVERVAGVRPRSGRGGRARPGSCSETASGTRRSPRQGAAMPPGSSSPAPRRPARARPGPRVYMRVRARVSAKATVPTRSPTTVAPKASRRFSASALTSPSPSAASPGASGISVPISPIAGPARTSSRVRSSRR